MTHDQCSQCSLIQCDFVSPLCRLLVSEIIQNRKLTGILTAQQKADKAYYERNRAKRIEKAAEWNRTNKDRRNEIQARYRAA